MPIYEFKCNSCNHEFEALFLSADDSLPNCTKCNSNSVEKLLSAGSFRPNGIPVGSGGFKPPSCGRAGGG